MRLFLPPLPGWQLPCTLALFAWFCAALSGADAATLIVTNTNDSGGGSLRQALADASDGDTVQFDAALNGQTITLTSGELVIDKDVTINGPGPDLLTVETLGQFRIFHVIPTNTVGIGGLTISRGNDSGSGVRNDQATLTINNCTVISGLDNTTSGGGGIYNNGENAILTIVDTTVSSNWAFGGAGGGIYNNGGTLRITGSIISLNMATGISSVGGGIFNVGMMDIYHSAISDNHASIAGGGIYNVGTLTITDSTINGNLAGSPLQGSGFGGGISNERILVIRNSTIHSNSASGKNSGTGGGIASGGSNGTLEIINSTISSNSANLDGGGIANSAPLTLTHSTMSDNAANRNGGGMITYATLEIGHTILSAGVSGANIFNNGGTVTSLGYNLSSDNGGGFLTANGDQINTDPLLGPLQDNGGLTFTHEPLTGSPAINAGDPNFTPPPLFDQRGYPRVFSGRIDIGSLEVQPAPTPSPTPTASPSPTATATPPITPTPTATATPSATPTLTPIPTATPTATPSASPTPSPTPARALNISTRLRVETGNSVLIGGFIIAGSAPKGVAVRGIGPSLAAFGINDALADPTLEVRSANGALIADNDNWQDNPAQAAQLTTLGLAPQHPNESGIVATLNSGASYTAILAGKNGGTGIGLVEIYDTNQGSDSQLANISTRGFVQTGNNVMIGGFILAGNSNTAIAVRGVGPSLAQFGLSPVLANPTLELRDSNGALLIANDNWQDDPVSAAQLTAHGLSPQNSLEPGIFASLPPGAFTAILAGKDGGTGIGLVEIYNVQ